RHPAPPVRSALNPGTTEARRPRPVYGKMGGGWRSAISIDFPMPRKTHVGTLKIAPRSQRPFCRRFRHAWYAVRLPRLGSRAVGPFAGAPFYNALMAQSEDFCLQSNSRTERITKSSEQENQDWEHHPEPVPGELLRGSRFYR